MKLLDTFTTSSQNPITVQGKTKLNVHFDVFEFTENYFCFRETERAARMFLSSNPPPPTTKSLGRKLEIRFTVLRNYVDIIVKLNYTTIKLSQWVFYIVIVPAPIKIS